MSQRNKYPIRGKPKAQVLTKYEVVKRKKKRKRKSPGFLHVLLMLEISKPSYNAKKKIAQAYLIMLEIDNRRYRE